jgi:NAD(P)-dependent dehydrogenase (short-subunit alcohol dehydrogenase family)
MKDGGSIILTGSGIWQKGIPVYPTYGATKAALRSFVRTWTADLAGKGIRANVISPGPVETPILRIVWREHAGSPASIHPCLPSG